MKKTAILVVNETTFIINDGLTLIGRDPVTCQIILTNVTISKHHAVAIKINDNFYISDFQSTNGTKLEEVSLQPRVCYEIIDNATLTFGDVKCKFIIQEYNAIFKTPTALSKKFAAGSKESLNTTKVISTNIHDLPTQLEDGFQDSTQQILDKSVEETQILESSIIETPNVSKIRPNISRTKHTDDFIIPETQSENFRPEESYKNFEIDESNNSDQFELSNIDISDAQMAEVHDSIIQSPLKQKTHNINEEETQLEFGSPNSLKPSVNHNLPTQNIASNVSSQTLSIYDMETQQFDKPLPRKSSPLCKKNIYEAETQLFTTQFQKNILEKPTSPRSKKNLHEGETQLSDTQQFEKPQKSSSPNRNIYDAETQILDYPVDTSRQKITTDTDSDLTSSNNSNAQLLEDKIDVKINTNIGDPHAEIDELEETQFEFDAEPNIEKPTLPSKKTNNFDTSTQRILVENEVEDLQSPINKQPPILNFNTPTSDIQHFEKSQKPSSPRNIYDAETQILDYPVVTPRQKITTDTDSDLTSSNNSNNQMLKDKIDLKMNTNIGESHAENEELEETQFEFDAEPNIEKPTLHSKKTHNFDTSTQKIIIENDVEDLPSPILNFKTPTSVLRGTNTIAENDSIFDQSTLILTNEQIDTPSSKFITPNVNVKKFREENSTSSTPLNVKTNYYLKRYLETVSSNTSSSDIEIYDIPTQVMENYSNIPKIVLNSSTKKNQGSEQPDSDLFDMPTQVMTGKSINEKKHLSLSKKNQRSESPDSNLFDMPTQVTTNKSINEKTHLNDSELPEANDIFDIPTQALGTITDISKNKKIKETSHPSVSKASNSIETTDIFDIPTQASGTITDISQNKQVKETSQPSVSKASNSVETTDIFDIPTQTLTAVTDISKNKQIKKSSNHSGVPKAANIVDSLNIFDVPTQAFETVKINSPKVIGNDVSHSSEKLLHDEDLENILNNEPETLEINVAASSSTDDLSINKKSVKRRAHKTESSTRKMTRKTTNREKFNKKSTELSSGDPKETHCSSSNHSACVKDSDHETEKKKTNVDQTPKVEDIQHKIDKVNKSVGKSNETDAEGIKRNLRGSRNQRTSVKNLDRSPDKDKSSKKSKQNKLKDGTENGMSKDSNNDNKVLERLEMIITTTKEVINTKLKNEDQSDRADVGQTSSNRSTRTSRKRSGASETLESKKSKISNNKQKLVEENNNKNNEKLIKKQKSEETIKLTRKTTNQQSTNSTNEPAVKTSTRPVRKSKIPLKFEDNFLAESSRKREHSLSTRQSTSESSVCAISPKVQKMGTNCIPAREKFRVMFTIFRDEEQEQTVKKLGGKVVEKSKEANVLVTNQIKRSVKLLNAISQAIPIVSPRWLDVCKQSKNFVDPWKFLLDDLEAEKRFKFRLQESLNIAKQNGLLFQGYTVLLTKSVPTDLKDILESAGAKCISSWPKNITDKHIIVSSIDDKSQWPKHSKVLIVAAEAIFSSVVRQKIDLKNYLLI